MQKRLIDGEVQAVNAFEASIEDTMILILDDAAIPGEVEFLPRNRRTRCVEAFSSDSAVNGKRASCIWRR